MHHCLESEKKKEAAELEQQETLSILQAKLNLAELELGELKKEEWFKLSDDSETLMELKEFERLHHKIVMDVLGDFRKKPDTFTQANVNKILDFMTAQDKYRLSKIQLEMIKHLRFETKNKNK